MRYHTLSENLPQTSVLGFGCWAMGGGVWGPTDDQEAVRAAAMALDAGINLFDTAPGYGMGRSEELLAQALGARRTEAIVVTKFGMPWDETGAMRGDTSRESVRRELEGSLRRLKTDYVDLYLMHWADGKTPIADVAATLHELKREGKIRALGFCNIGPDELAEAVRVGPVDAVQIPYCLFIRGVEKDLLPFCLDKKIGVMAYGSLGYGILSGRMTPDTQFEDGDWRSGKVFGSPNWREQEALFAPAHFARNLRKVEQWKTIAARSGHTVAQLALAWTLAHPAVSVGLVGVKRPEQLRENLGAGDWVLSPEDLAEIAAVLHSE